MYTQPRSKPYHISETKPSEVLAILDINNAAVPAVNYLKLSELKNICAESSYFLSVSLQSELAGFVLALREDALYASVNYRWFASRYPRFLYIDRIVIAPRFQSCGIGRQLYDHLASLERGRSKTLLCEVNLRPKNTNSLLFHKGYGFQQVGVQETEAGAKKVAMMEYSIGS